MSILIDVDADYRQEWSYMHIHRQAGAWLVRKLRQQQRELGTYRAARNCRKQGMPLDLVLLVLRRGTK